MASPSHRALAARYRRLLVCYPRDYRRERGAELVDLFLELAPRTRTWPTPREAANLVRHGLRCRLGRPASRTIVACAVLTAVLTGLLAAALATRAAWESARPLASEAEATRLLEGLALGQGAPWEVQPAPALFVSHNQVASFAEVMLGESEEYGLGSTYARVGHFLPADRDRILAVAAQRLRANGWQVSTRLVEPCKACGPPDARPEPYINASRRDDLLKMSFREPAESGGAAYLFVVLDRATPWTVYPAGLVAGFLGALSGFLVFGWASRRTEQRTQLIPGLTEVGLAGTLLLWSAPMLWSAPTAVAHHLRERPARWWPFWEWLGQPAAVKLLMVGGILAVAALAGATLCRRRHRRPADPAVVS